MTPRLPVPGGDTGNWGTVLNDFLAVVHDTAGALKAGSVTTTSLVDASVTTAKAAADLLTLISAKYTKPGGGIPASDIDTASLVADTNMRKVMAKLAEVGFSQSYTYFTWRTTKQELIDYGVEVSVGPSSEFMRPNFWPNTHDILLPPLRNGGVGAFKGRMVLAATMVPNYGIYSGYELLENEPLDAAKNTDYLNSEKYEVRERDFNVPNNLKPWITIVNTARQAHPALQELHNIWFHGSDNDHVIAYSKQSADGSDTVLVVVNLDPLHAQESTLNLDLGRMGIAWERPFEVFDEITRRSFPWAGPANYVRLEADEPAHILHIRQG